MNPIDKLKAQAEAARKQSDLVDRLITVLELGWTIEELREAILMYDRASGALVPSVAKQLPRSSDLKKNRTRAHFVEKEIVCRYCGDKFLSQRSDAIMCTKRECRHKREKFLDEQRKIAEGAVEEALKDGTLQQQLELTEVGASIREKAAHLVVRAKDRGRVLVAGDAVRIASDFAKRGHLK